ncbi:hypothetical protein N7495_001882 [Penicillium taxi]|uniref:uncharacterized protein n=1 Tax=Penicillium taxi TaxID=168475 RepID=UPI002545466C|nr:uncharacterized protein N7495_001882 [Penicillium taxi]KAJ5909200.1 hypothetical protein N7495_001882 [Penicillium taxi]
MDIPPPTEGDVNIGEYFCYVVLFRESRFTDRSSIGSVTFDVCWVLTALVGLALLFRYGVKIWLRWSLPQVSAPERIWGTEDLFFFVGYCFDLTHMILIHMSTQWGLGRHFFYLTAEEKMNALKWDFISQPFAVTAAMVSRTGMMWFLLTCFATSDRKIRLSIIVCAVVQIVANMITTVQIILQCGPNPYRSVDRTQYFHYMWTALPEDGSVKCQSPNVQTTIGFVQGGFNSIIDFFLAVLAAVELWQFFLRTLQRDHKTSFWSQFQSINRTVRSRRIWQTLTLSGPLLLSGAASIVKTYKLKSLGDRLDFTYNIVSFILWVKIENYSILLASCAPVARLFLRTVVDARRDGRPFGYWSKSRSNDNTNQRKEFEMKPRVKDQWMDTTLATTTDWKDEETQAHWDGTNERSASRISRAMQPDHIDDGCVTVKTDIVVEVDVDDRHSRASSGAIRLLPDGGEPSYSEN